jgi:holo-[acyl-carrier protein] synthase
MITGTGIDMVEVDRIAEKIEKDKGFREKVFSRHEIEFCESKANKYEHYGARFAAKEAFLKATGMGLMAGFEIHNIETFNDDSGKPFIRLKNEFEQLAADRKWNKIHVSLTHVKSMACAVVVLEA